MFSPVAECNNSVDLSVPLCVAVIPVVPALEFTLVTNADKSVVVTTAEISAAAEPVRLKDTVPSALTAASSA
jgi:hypothetical protein